MRCWPLMSRQDCDGTDFVNQAHLSAHCAERAQELSNFPPFPMSRSRSDFYVNVDAVWDGVGSMRNSPSAELDAHSAILNDKARPAWCEGHLHLLARQYGAVAAAGLSLLAVDRLEVVVECPVGQP